MPFKRVQCFMEWLHIGQGLEWWQTIIGTTILIRWETFVLFSYSLQFFKTSVLVFIPSPITRFHVQLRIYFRLIVFPVVVLAQRNMAHMSNNAPEMARLQVCNLFNDSLKKWDDFRKNSLRRVKGTTCMRLTEPRNNCRCALLHF